MRAIREMLTVYRDVYLKETSLVGYDLLKAIDAHYKKRKRKEFARVPMALAGRGVRILGGWQAQRFAAVYGPGGMTG